MSTHVDDVTAEIVDAALKIHKGLGPGLLESVYRMVLAKELVRRGLSVEVEKTTSFVYDGMTFDNCLRVDILVNQLVVVELKSVENIAAVHAKQVLTYLRLLGLPVGLLINFGHETLKQGLQRIVNGYVPSAAPRLRVRRR